MAYAESLRRNRLDAEEEEIDEEEEYVEEEESDEEEHVEEGSEEAERRIWVENDLKYDKLPIFFRLP